jgi:hypothetical protein
VCTHPPYNDRASTHDATGCVVSLEAIARLRNAGYSSLLGVHCDFDRGTLRLRGCLPSHYLKQIAQTAVNDLVGVCAVDNQIVIRPLARAVRKQTKLRDDTAFLSSIESMCDPFGPPSSNPARTESAESRFSTDRSSVNEGTSPFSVSGVIL